MKARSSAVLVVGVAALALAPPAFAAAGIINTSVTPLGDVTYSTPASGNNSASTNYLGARVSIGSDPANTNTINHVRFTATATTTSANKVVFSSFQGEGVTCTTTLNPGTTTNDGTSIDCQIGQLRAGQQFPPFVVFFKAPAQTTGDPTDATITLATTTWWAEGTGGVPGPSPENSFSTNSATFGLGISDSRRLKTAIASPGGRFFTGGNFGVPNKVDDFFATTLIVPAVAPTHYSTATIEEMLPSPISTQPAQYKCPPTYVDCKDIAEIDVKDQTGATRVFVSTDPLKIILRRDKSQFTGNLNNQPVWWFNGEMYEQIYACSNNADPLAGTVERCVKECKVLRNNDPEVKVNPELSGDGQCIVWAKNNGFYAW